MVRHQLWWSGICEWRTCSSIVKLLIPNNSSACTYGIPQNTRHFAKIQKRTATRQTSSLPLWPQFIHDNVSCPRVPLKNTRYFYNNALQSCWDLQSHVQRRDNPSQFRQAHFSLTVFIASPEAMQSSEVISSVLTAWRRNLTTAQQHGQRLHQLGSFALSDTVVLTSYFPVNVHRVPAVSAPSPEMELDTFAFQRTILPKMSDEEEQRRVWVQQQPLAFLLAARSLVRETCWTNALSTLR